MLSIQNLQLKHDMELADGVINGKLKVESGIFNEHSMIYRTTNETISDPNYFGNMKNKEKVLAITGSGDQIINAILQGAKEVKGIDISKLVKYFVALKLAAIQKLNQEDFLNFIIGDISKRTYPLGIDYYEKARTGLVGDIKKFWDYIFTRYTQEDLEYSKLFGSFTLSKQRVIVNNPYLQGLNYKLVRRKLKDVNIELSDGNIFETDVNSMGKFDLILLSNLFNYVGLPRTGNKEKAEEYKQFLRSLPLKENGIALTYNFVFDGFIKEYFNDKDFSVYDIDERMVNISIENELIEYKKPRRLAINFLRRK